uniref:RNase H type-1 domain-containing protein n=1 Tax=Cannabis sativa TaxID=3483 RepID=A0A803NUT3_CANSA
MIERGFKEHSSLLVQNVESIEAGGGIEVVRWGLLRPGRMKCFVDFAYAEDQGDVAAVIFDAEGVVKWFGAKKVSFVSVMQGELEALSFGVSLVRHLAEVGADFYSDNLPLVSGLSEGRSPHWGIRFTFNKFCNDFDITRHFVVWISRVFNEAAHTLARWGLTHSCNGYLPFLEVSPHVLTKFLCLA